MKLRGKPTVVRPVFCHQDSVAFGNQTIMHARNGLRHIIKKPDDAYYGAARSVNTSEPRSGTTACDCYFVKIEMEIQLGMVR